MGATESLIAAFSEEHTARLTGISISQLRYWDRTDFYHPDYAETNRRMAFSRVYSFKDIVALRVLDSLRNQYSCPLQHLREVSEKLSHLVEDRWTGVRLFVVNKRVIWIEPGTELPQSIATGQYLVPMLLDEVVTDTRHNVAKLNFREEAKQGVIDRSRFISHNAPIIAGTRITVGAIKRFSQAGYTLDQIIKEYPDLTEKDVKAALAYDDARLAA